MVKKLLLSSSFYADLFKDAKNVKLSYYDPTITVAVEENPESKIALKNVDGTLYTPKQTNVTKNNEPGSDFGALSQVEQKDDQNTLRSPTTDPKMDISTGSSQPKLKLLKLNLEKDKGSKMNDSRYKNSEKTIPSYSPNKKLMYENLDSILGNNDLLDVTLDEVGEPFKWDKRGGANSVNSMRSSFNSYQSFRNNENKSVFIKKSKLFLDDRKRVTNKFEKGNAEKLVDVEDPEVRKGCHCNII